MPEIADRLGLRSANAVSTRMYSVLAPQGRVKLAPIALRFSAEENRLLAKLTKEGLTASRLLPYFPGRNRISLYTRMLKLQRPAGSANFTPAEDAELCRLRDQDHLTWAEVAARMPSHDRSSLVSPYTRITPLSARTCVRLRRDRDGTASSEIRRLRDSGLTWEAVSEKMLPLSRQTVRTLYWQTAVNGTTQQPHQDRAVTFARFTAHENEELIRLKALGVPWKEVTKFFPGRELGYLQNRLAWLRRRSRDSPKPKIRGSLVNHPVTQPSSQQSEQP
ncbi:hypothetical protein LTR33_002315 [Friedmanniomyces endolithicus]|nr:hypothetical protein LTR33_002315 [Friedmanniomyces endolithicus]